MIERQLLSGFPEKDYHALPHLSSTGVRALLRTPAHFRAAQKTMRIATPAMQWGTIIHAALLEPHRFDELVYRLPESVPERRKDVDKQWWADTEAKAAGRPLLRYDETPRLDAIVSAVRATPAASLFLQGGLVESTLLWQRRASNGTVVPCRARPDFMLPDASIVVDLKKTADASPAGFARSVWNYRYDVQAAHYLDGITEVCERIPSAWLFCAIEMDEPFGVAWYRASPQMLDFGGLDLARAVDLYAECTARDEWNCYPDEIMNLDLPRWARHDEQPATED